MSLTGAALQTLSGVTESGPLADEAVAALPGPTSPPPWECRVRAVLWWHRAAPGAADALLPALRGRRTLPVTMGAFVRYLDTPVGPYSEVFGSPLLVFGDRHLPGVSVPFIAVDSAGSVRGGREHWSLPKVLATLAWAAADEATADGVTADGDGWSVSARGRARGPAFPLAGVLPSVTPSGATAVVRQRGVARAARVVVTSSGPTLPSWLLAGSHPGLVIRHASMLVGPPR